jgi:hypothetical protein
VRSSFYGIINPKIIGMMLIVAAASIGLVTIGFQGTMASIMLADLEEDVEAGNATMMITNQTADGNTTGVEFLGIQPAQSGSISQVNATAYTLEMNNVSDSTILFSDRPERIVETVSTSDFVGNWTTGPNSFAVDAPNAALVIEDMQSGELETAVVEFFNPINNAATNALTYTIMAENATSIDLPREFGQTILVINNPPCNPSSDGTDGVSLNDCGY